MNGKRDILDDLERFDAPQKSVALKPSRDILDDLDSFEEEPSKPSFFERPIERTKEVLSSAIDTAEKKSSRSN